MPFNIRETKSKVKSSNKTIYMPDHIIEQINKIANANDTSFNNIIVSMVVYCLEEVKDEKETK